LHDRVARLSRDCTAGYGKRFDFNDRFESRRDHVKVRRRMVGGIDPDDDLANLVDLAHASPRSQNNMYFRTWTKSIIYLKIRHN
jgi:hypothetical protein